jgi:hypothetical protein
MWHQLVQLYAIRAREFSDAVARLGQHKHEIGPETLKLLDEIKTRHAICIALSDEVDRYRCMKHAASSNGEDNYKLGNAPSHLSLAGINAQHAQVADPEG